MKNPFTFKNAFRNPGLKLVGLGMALLLWFHVATNREYETSIQYSFDFINLPDSLVLAARPAATIEATAKGSGKLLLRFLLQTRRWEIDLSDAQIGRHTIALGPSAAPIYGIEGFEVLDLKGRDHVTLAIDSLAAKKVPIVSDCVWEIATDFVRVGAEQWYPESVLVRGPKEAIARILSVKSIHLETRDQSGPFDREVELAVPDAYGVEIAPEKARFYQAIEQYVTKEYPNLEISVATTSSGDTCEVDPRVVNVTLGGPRSAMNQVVPESISVVCAVAEHDTSGGRRSLWIHVPEPLQVLEANPDSVTIWRYARPQTSSRY